MRKTRTPLTWIAALRPFSFPASVLPLLIGTAASASIREWRWGILAIEMAVVVLLHSIGNLLNDYFDYRQGADSRSSDDAGRPGRFLLTGEFRPDEYFRFAGLLLLLLIPGALHLGARGGWPALVIAGIGLLGGYAYTGPPFRLKSRGLGEICIFVVFGPAIAAGASWMQTGRLTPNAMYCSAPVGMLVAAILAANNLRDFEEDSAGNVRTLAQVLGRRLYLWVLLGLLFVPPLFLIGFVLRGAKSAWVLLAWLALPAAAGPARDAISETRRPDADIRAAKYQAAFSALMLAGLIAGSAF